MNFCGLKAKYIKHREILFLLVFALYYSSLILKATVLEDTAFFEQVLELIRKICYVGILGLFGLNIIFSVYQKKTSIFMIAIFAGLAGLGISSYNFVTVVLWLFMCCAFKLSFKKIIKTAMLLSAVILILFFAMSKCGFIENRVYIRADGTRRSSLGFQYTTNIANFYLPLILMYMLLKKRIHIFEVAILALINVYIYIMTDTKSVFAFVFISIVLYVIYAKLSQKNVLNRLMFYMSVAAAPCAYIFCMLLQYFYSNGGEIINKVNDILSGRLRLAQQGIENFGISLTGQYIVWNGGNVGDTGPYNYVDSSFIQYMLNFGLIYILFTLILYIMMGIKVKKEKNVMLALILVMIVGHSIFDPQLMWLEFNPFLLYAFAKDDINEYGQENFRA